MAAPEILQHDKKSSGKLSQRADRPKEVSDKEAGKPLTDIPLRQLIGKTGSESSVKKHSLFLEKTANSNPTLANQALLTLQQQHGNRYVQRVVALSRSVVDDSSVAPEIEQSIQQARGGGRELDRNVRAQMESSFDADFSGVRVHTNSQADTLNRALRSRAFTTGNDIFFRQDEYSPGSFNGRKLLAHELTHVVQQTGGVHAKMSVGQPGDKYELEADRVAEQVMRMSEVQVPDQEEDEEVQIQKKAQSDQKTLSCQHPSHLVHRDVVTFEEGSTIVGQRLGPHLYNQVDSGLTTEPAPGISISFTYRVYEVNSGVDIDRLYNDLETLYGYGRFTSLTASAAAYLGTRIAPGVNRFFALYGSRSSREPVDLSRLGDLRLGIASPREVAAPGITTGFTGRREEAWTALAPTARVYINDWADWSLRGLDRFLEEIPMEEDRSVPNAISVLGNVAWALTAFIPVVGPITRAVVGGISLAGALTASFASIAPGVDLNTARKRAIRDVQEREITRVADGLEQPSRLSPILITVLVKAQERGMPASQRDALLWNHMFNVPYTIADTGRRNRLRQRAYYSLRRSWGRRIR